MPAESIFYAQCCVNALGKRGEAVADIGPWRIAMGGYPPPIKICTGGGRVVVVWSSYGPNRASGTVEKHK